MADGANSGLFRYDEQRRNLVPTSVASALELKGLGDGLAGN